MQHDSAAGKTLYWMVWTKMTDLRENQYVATYCTGFLAPLQELHL
jgi:hypothetical protein